MKNDKEKWARVRIIMVSCLFAFGFLAVTARSFYLQILEHDQLVKLAERQHHRTIPITPARGGIFDRTGAPLAVSLEMDSLYAEPKRISDPARTAAALAPLVQLPQHELQRKLDSEKGFAWLARQIPPETAVKIKQLKLPGIGFVKENKRFYPNFEMASHVLGFTGMDPGGLEGLERRYDATILGKTGYLLTERDALGRDVSVRSAVVQDAAPGKNLYLTLDKNIQYFTEKELAKVTKQSSVLLMLSIVYGMSITMLFSASALYHAKKRSEDENSIWRKMDHLAIFLMIAGTYTPISYIFLEGKWRWGIIIAQWSLVALGALFKFFFLRSPRYISAGIYLAMGWMAVLIMGKIFRVMSPDQIMYLVGGGLSFTMGAIIYMMKRPNPLPERVGFHGIFHIFILLGGLFHYFMVFDAVNSTMALAMKS